ncbi:hypothetical protein [Rhodohalobacter sp. 8-1]|uniref:hypothetical protein n=1 Tax=Rhodohalobacter sp. 8-1 TaxID=3131972 RepID=UPI0030EBC198
MNQEYTAIAVSNGRADVKESSNEDYRIELKRAESIQFNTTTNQTIPSDSFKYYHIDASEPGKEISVAAVGSGVVISGNVITDPIEDFLRVGFAGSQSIEPTLLETSGNYLLRVSSETNISANFDLTIVDLEPSQDITLLQNDVISENGSIRLSGDIDRFDFIPDANGTITISIKPADSNSLDDSGDLNVQVAELPNVNRIVRPSSEDTFPIGDELYIWEGAVSALNDYRISILDQAASATGDFILEIEFTPDS